jgi:DegV family protein with EDD domain
MSRVCILTDSTAQFPFPNFKGYELVNVIPMHVQMDGKLYTDGKDIKAANLPVSARNLSKPQALPPTPEEFRQTISSLGRKYHEIIVLLVSSHLCPVVESALEAAEALRGIASIHIIDSQTTAVGLGLLVQSAAEAAFRGDTSLQINRLVRGMLPRIYTVFCLQSLTYLYHSGHLDPAQAIVGEMLGVTPFFILENGRLVPIQKVRNSRHLVDMLHEFIAEFANLKHIALVQGVPPFDQEARNLKERINGDFPTATFSEHTLGAALATILGPRCLGVVAMEHCTDLSYN